MANFENLLLIYCFIPSFKCLYYLASELVRVQFVRWQHYSLIYVHYYNFFVLLVSFSIALNKLILTIDFYYNQGFPKAISFVLDTRHKTHIVAENVKRGNQ